MIKTVLVFNFEGGRLIAKGMKILLGVTEMLYILSVVVVTWALSFVKTHRTIHLKLAHFISCIAYFNKVYKKKIWTMDWQTQSLTLKQKPSKLRVKSHKALSTLNTHVNLYICKSLSLCYLVL